MGGNAFGAMWRALGIGSWVAGIALLHRQAVLPSSMTLVAAAALALAQALAACVVGRRTWRGRALLAGAALLAGWSFAGWRAGERLADRLAPEWEDREIEIVGVVDEMPQVREDGLQFAFLIESASARASASASAVGVGGVAGAGAGAAGAGADSGKPVVPTRVRLSWMRGQRDDRVVVGGAPALRAGERWSLPVRLRRPHGVLNPEGFDSELGLFEQGLRATGTVRGEGTRLGETWAPIERARQWGRDRLLLSDLDPSVAGTLAALAVGDQSAIAASDWETYRDAGVAHLMSISGMHITMLGWLGGRLLAAAWRLGERALLWVPAPIVGRWGGVLVAWGYSIFAGWGLPAQRTVWMLGGVCLLRGLAIDWPAPLLALTAMLPVTLVDPWAVLQPGFWLSFAAVAWLMVSRPVREVDADAPALVQASEPAPALATSTSTSTSTSISTAASPSKSDSIDAAAATPTPFSPSGSTSLLGRLAAIVRRHVRDGLRAQLIATVGLAPLALVAFQQWSLVGLLANLVAEPWVTLVVVPIALAGLVFAPAWSVAAAVLLPLQHLLGWLAHWPGASLHVATAPAWLVVAGLAGGVVVMLPLPRTLRLMGLPLVLPLLAPDVPRPPAGLFELMAVDVGQGSAIIVRTQGHLLVFDTGPRFGDAGDAGQRMLVPLLQARGERAVDLLVLSHADADHVGGARSLIERWPVHALSSSLAASHPLRHAGVSSVSCAAGQRWQWDGVVFEMLHPFDDDTAGRTNARSCVLRVTDAQGRAALLPGDIEGSQEAALVGRTPASLRADILLVPHHGSHTSSTSAFIAAVRPRVAVMQLGYRNRYGHPAPTVVARYGAAGVQVVRSDTCGAWRWFDGIGTCLREERRRYWQWRERVD